MEVLNFFESYWQVITGIILISIGAVKFFYEMKALQERVKILEQSLSDNYTNDTMAKEDVTLRLTQIDTKIDTFGLRLESFQKAMKAILKELKIPDML